jgi:hypothetical protein
MVCRHRPGDPDCSSNRPAYRDPSPVTPDADNYTIEEVERVGSHLVMKVLYPNCRSCAFEGNKVMVFLNVSEAEVLRWRRIDPHFRDPKRNTALKAAPSPAARFPASAEGWEDALRYAREKRS